MFNTIYVEPTYGCGCVCPACPGYGDKDHWFMDIATAQALVQRIIESTKGKRKHHLILSLRGEPTLNENLLDIIRCLSPHVRTVDLHTNGRNWSLDAYNDAFRAGVNRIQINVDACKNTTFMQLLPKASVPVYDYDDKRKNSGEDCFVLLHKAALSDKRKRKYPLHNWGGYEAFMFGENSLAHSACAEPLKSIVVRWNGDYGFCPHQWASPSAWGDVMTHSFYAHQHVKTKEARKLLKGPKHRGNIKCCAKCNVPSRYAGHFKFLEKLGGV